MYFQYVRDDTLTGQPILVGQDNNIYTVLPKCACCSADNTVVRLTKKRATLCPDCSKRFYGYRRRRGTTNNSSSLKALIVYSEYIDFWLQHPGYFDHADLLRQRCCVDMRIRQLTK